MKRPKERPDATNIGPNAFDGRKGLRQDTSNTSNRLHIRQDTNFSEVLQRFEGVRCQGGNQFKALCPAHDDHNPSLSIRVESDRLFLYCFAGCTIEDVTESIGLTLADLYHTDRQWSEQIRPIVNRKPRRKHPKPSRCVLREYDRTDVDSWDFHDEAGNVIATKIRTNYMVEYDDGTTEAKKTFRVEPKGVDLPLYRLPAVLSAVRQGWPVYLAEGEAKADRIALLFEEGNGADAVASSYGGHWKERHTETLANCSRVILVPDLDFVGQSKGQAVFRHLRNRSVPVVTVDLSPLFGNSVGRVAA